MPELNILEEIKKVGTHAFIEFIKSTRRILISDTTLRDGEQAPGASLTAGQKLTIAKQLDTLGVDAIEAGFPASGADEFEAVRLISREVKRPVISVLSRCRQEDITAAAESLKEARHWSISLFLGTSPVLLRHSLGKSQAETLDIIKTSIQHAKRYTDNIAFGAEDASRTEPAFLYRVYEEAIEAGAMVIGFPDTVGWLIPAQVKEMIEKIKKNVRNINSALLAIHFHNDLGLAVANSLAAIESGASIVQGTINGLGERAGNVSLEELVMALTVRHDYYKVKTGIDTTQFYKTSQLVSELTGIAVNPNKPIVGKNVFATEAGIHQAAMLKEPSSYQIISPKDVGQVAVKMVLGKHSGKHAVADRLRTLGFDLGEPEGHGRLDAIYERFKELAATKKEINDAELSDIAFEIIASSHK